MLGSARASRRCSPESEKNPLRLLPARAAQGDSARGSARRRSSKEIDELRAKIEAAGMSTRPSRRKPCANSIGCRRCRPRRPSTPFLARISMARALPWAKRTEEVIDLPKTRDVLDQEHSGLEKAEEGSHSGDALAVRKLNPDMKGPILCFVGPPGVGKTSLAKSIAHSLGRKFVRVSLGGMRDESVRSGDTAEPTLVRYLARSSRACGGPSPEPALHSARRDRQTRIGLPRRSGIGAPRSAGSRAKLVVS